MTMRRRLLPQRERRVEADVSFAIVNIVLLLILFFLATGALVNTPDQGINLSETRDLPVDQLPPPVLVVNDDRSLTLDGIDVTMTGLAEALNGETLLHVLIDKQAPALDLLDLLTEPSLKTLEIRLVTVHRRDGS